MELIPPSSKYGKSYLSAFNEMRDELNDFKTFWEEIGSPENIEDYIQLRLDHAKGLRLPKDWIPASTYWLIDGDEVIGETNIRHQLTDHLRNVGGLKRRQVSYWSWAA
jgi:predicted acetyltransferase